MKALYKPDNEVDLALIRSILEGEGIPFYVHNDHFGTMEIGPKIPLFNMKTVMVDEVDFDRAEALVNDFLETRRPHSVTSRNEYTWKDKLRFIAEALLFSWYMPGKQRRKWEDKEDE